MTTTNSDIPRVDEHRELRFEPRRWDELATRLHQAVSSRKALALGVSVSVHLLIAVAAGTVVLSTSGGGRDKRELVINLGELAERGDERALPDVEMIEPATEEAPSEEIVVETLSEPEEESDQIDDAREVAQVPETLDPATQEAVGQVVAPLEHWVEGYARLREAAERPRARRERPKTSSEQDQASAARPAEPARAPVTFAGAGVSEVGSVVFVVDASGPMVTSLPMVLEEVKRSVERLSAEQKFSVVLFREARKNGRERTERFSQRLVKATTEHKAELSAWLAAVKPGGASNPLRGLESGLALEPDVIFLLSRSVERSEGGVWGEGLEATLQRLERLNPDLGGGGRRVQIQTIAFLDNDPTGTLQAIAERHGPRDGKGYRVVHGSDELASGAGR